MIELSEQLDDEDIHRFAERSVRRNTGLRRRRAELRAFLASDRSK
jgi:hypothetical protein